MPNHEIFSPSKNTIMGSCQLNEEPFCSGPVPFSVLACCGLGKEAEEADTRISFIFSTLHFRSKVKEKLE